MVDDQPMILSVVVVPETAESPSPSRAASPANGTKRRHSSVSEQGGKRPRLSTEEINGYRRESITSTAPERKAERRRSGQTEVNAVERKRGQRLFGAMLGALSQRSPTTAQKRRADIEKKQQDKLKQQAEEFNQMKRERREKLLAMRREEQKKFDEESMRIRHANMLDMAYFLHTKSEPRLYYKPWEMRPEEEERIKAQAKDTQGIIDRELEEFAKQQGWELNQDSSKNGSRDVETEPPQAATLVGLAPSGDAPGVSLKSNGDTDHSASPMNHEPADDDEGKTKETLAVNDKEEREAEKQASAEPMKVDQSGPEPVEENSREPVDESGEVVLEAAEDTVIF